MPAFYPPHYLTVSVNASSSGDNTLVAAVAGKSIKLVAAELVAAGPVSVKYKDGAGSDFHAAIPLNSYGSYSLSQMYSPEMLVIEPYFQTTAGNALILNLSGAVAVTGWIKVVVE